MIDRKKVKGYFEGKSQLGPIILMVVGVVTFTFVVGIGLFIGGLVWYFGACTEVAEQKAQVTVSP